MPYACLDSPEVFVSCLGALPCSLLGRLLVERRLFPDAGVDCSGCFGGDYHGMPLKARPHCCRKIRNSTTTMSVAIKTNPYCSPIVIWPDFCSLNDAQRNRHADTCEYPKQFSRVIDQEQEKGEDREKSDEQPEQIGFLLICCLLWQMIHHGIDAFSESCIAQRADL